MDPKPRGIAIAFQCIIVFLFVTGSMSAEAVSSWLNELLVWNLRGRRSGRHHASIERKKEMARRPIIPWVSEPPAPHVSVRLAETLSHAAPTVPRRTRRGRERGSFVGRAPTLVRYHGNQTLFHRPSLLFLVWTASTAASKKIVAVSVLTSGTSSSTWIAPG